MRLEAIREERESKFDVVVSSKLGRYADIKQVAYDEAKQNLNRMVGDMQSDIFPEDPLATIEWKNEGNAAVITQHTGNKIFFYIMRNDKI